MFPANDSPLIIEDFDVRIGSVDVVRDLNLAVGRGEFWGLLGPNGVGKTTLLKAFAGVFEPERGGIRLDGRRLDERSRRDIAQRLGMLPQHTHYAFDATCLETALVGRHPHLKPWARESTLDHERARDALADLEMLELAERSCMDLSGGESRRLALATLLVQDPAVMLLDEPTNHLDPAYQVTILNVLHRQVRAQRKSALMALHEVNLATCYCTHVLLLYGNGEWDAGPTSELLTADNLSRLYRCRVRLVDDGHQRVFAVAGGAGQGRE
ncbi:MULTISPECIES: ABC transporter ATP-binding protein [unclassified Wenzhouxiangella]|uniref:ABC transporter ATP-binding protein n=1 Tax=unclassified Wenzhouxiangella TaxID=2613841 RepID=UPI000E32A8AB|nr:MULTISPECIES: ABC transporter ATP-binding protein [unclassified Wenzhouxiangella]RFF27067.1 ABC transporter ATP-binding protein [Wenzhouxiangella sp. 15181]RFP67173.1 ABC transporter ATP-binding protein [Wenzhouxiangella sp. 15190]